MITEGLLWFDDDPRRPLLEKIANAVERYSERTGWQPTVCEAYPAQVETFNADLARAAATPARRRASATSASSTKSGARLSAKASAKPTVELPPKLRVVANTAMRPNHFLIGIEAGERPRKAVSPAASRAARIKADHATPVRASEKPAPTPSASGRPMKAGRQASSRAKAS